MIVSRLISASLIFLLKAFVLVFYKVEAKWVTPKDEVSWSELRLAIILNHTSLYEPLFIAALPNKRLWRATRRVVTPVADKTMNRPFLGRLFKIMNPNIIPITRKRDDSWDKVVECAQGDSIIMIFPEGRMKRANGLDKDGNPMSVKGGIADLLSKLDSGKMLIAYSGGLHHVQAPGQILPRLFKKIEITFEEVDIPEYKRRVVVGTGAENFKGSVIADLESRMQEHC